MIATSRREYRILVLEDEALVAMHIEDTLDELGYTVIGPVQTIEEAIACLDAAAVDAALLDINLGEGITSFPVAHVLNQRGIPFAFLTGYGAKGLHEEFKEQQVLVKPVDERLLVKTLRSLGT